jgi:hypothetical protein
MFDALPIEIIESITQYLELDDLLKLRQTCAKLYHKAANLSSHLFFKAITSNDSRQDA